MKLSIIIPVFNEEETVAEIMKRVWETRTPGYDKEIIVVDDGSTDKTGDVLTDLNKKIDFIFLRHKVNRGKGAAIRTAILSATGNFVLMQDADLEYSPGDYNSLLNSIEGNETVVYGSRNINPIKKGYFHYVWGVKILTFLINILFNSRLTDSYTCFKLIPTHLMRSMNLKSNRFEIEAELTVKILKSGYSIKEIPIYYDPRKFSEGKKINFLDGIIGIWTILKYWVN